MGLVVNPGNYFRRLRESLKPGGRVAIVAARPEASVGSPKQMRAPAAQVKHDMARQGYGVVPNTISCRTSTSSCSSRSSS